MDKRYQVFVSSTYEDLREERSAAILSLLKLKCIPAGMEIFPSSDDAVWEIIQKTIQESDYYILIIAGHYGSISNDGKTSWTEREYDYAQHIKKPTFVFFYKELGEMKINDIDDKDKVAAFREKVKGRMLRTCHSIDNLQTEITIAIANAKDNIPAVGWVRGDTVDKITTSIQNDIIPQKDLSKLSKTEYIDFINEFCVDVESNIEKVGFTWCKSSAESLNKAIDELLPLRDRCVKTVLEVTQKTDEPEQLISSLLDWIIPKFLNPIPKQSFQDRDFEHIEFFVWEFFLFSAACLLHYEKYCSLASILQYKYNYGPWHHLHKDCGHLSFVYFNVNLGCLDNNFNYPDGSKYVSYAAWKLRQRNFMRPFSFDKLCAADIILCQLTSIYFRFEKTYPWYPFTNEFDSNRKELTDFWKKLDSKRNCESMLPLFNLNSVQEIKDLIENERIQSNEKMEEINQRKVGSSIPNIADMTISFEVGERA